MSSRLRLPLLRLPLLRLPLLRLPLLRLPLLSALLLSALLLQPALALPGSPAVRTDDTLPIARTHGTHGTDAPALMRQHHLDSPTLHTRPRLTLPEPQPDAAGEARLNPPAALPDLSRLPRPAGLPTPTPGEMRGPVPWHVTPQPTVASFIGYLPSVLPAAFSNALPVRTYLAGLAFSLQTYNNCGPSALSSVLGFYKANVSQDKIRLATRRDGGYMQVSAIAPELAQYGLRSVTIHNGRLEQVKRLLALGIPVIVLQWLDRPGHIDHFRVVRGYDDQAGVVWVSDSMVGPVAYLSYNNFDALWNTQGRQMFPVYPKGFDRRVKDLL